MTDIIFNTEYTGPIVDFIPQVTEGLQALHFPALNAAETARNYFKQGSGDAAIIGSPSFNSDNALLKSANNYLQTTIDETPSLSFFAVVASDDTLSSAATNPMFGGTQFSNLGFGIYYNGSIRANVTVKDGSGVITQPVMALTAAAATMPTPRLLSLVITEGVGAVLRDWTNNLSTTLANTNGRVVNTGNKVRVGSSYRTDFQGTSRFYAFEHHNVALSEANQQRVVAGIRGFLKQRRSLTV